MSETHPMPRHHTLSVLVENKFGVLARVAGLFARRGYNIYSLAVAPTEDERFSRITIVVDVESAPLEQVVKQLYKLINVVRIQELAPGEAIDRELLLATVEATPDVRQQILELVSIFDGKVLDVGHNQLTVSLEDVPERVDDFEELLRPYGIENLQRTGRIALAKLNKTLSGLRHSQPAGVLTPEPSSGGGAAAGAAAGPTDLEALDIPEVPARIRRALRAIAIAVGIGFVVFVAWDSGPYAPSGRLGSDLPSFYAAGELIVDQPDQLYDPDIQAQKQENLYPEGQSGFLYFAYPVYAALPYVPLAALPFRLAYVVWSALMVAALVGGIYLLRPIIPVFDRWFEQVIIVSLIFYPLFAGVLGGQNTPLTFLLIAVAARAFYDGQEWITGGALALLLFKPHFSLPFIGLAVLGRRWRIVAAAGIGGFALYAVGALYQGWGWLGPWLDQVVWFGKQDTIVNGHIGISFPMVAEKTWGVGDPVARIVGWSLVLVCGAVVLWAWWHADRLPYRVLLALTIPALLIGSPHTVFYDGGLLIVPLAVLAEDWHRNWKGIVAVVVLAALHGTSADIGYTVVFPIAVGVFLWVLFSLVLPAWRAPNRPAGVVAVPSRRVSGPPGVV